MREHVLFWNNSRVTWYAKQESHGMLNKIKNLPQKIPELHWKMCSKFSWSYLQKGQFRSPSYFFKIFLDVINTNFRSENHANNFWSKTCKIWWIMHYSFSHIICYVTNILITHGNIVLTTQLMDIGKHVQGRDSTQPRLKHSPVKQ